MALAVEYAVKPKPEGKRWIRMKENRQFSSNPHITAPQARDYILQHSYVKTTFPEPLPRFLSRSASAPSAILAISERSSAHAGRFSISLKGARKTLRKHPLRAGSIIRVVEAELISWLLTPAVILHPDDPKLQSFVYPGRIVLPSSPSISEVHRSHSQLVWTVADDAFARYVIHCCSRYHGIVSYSKNVSDGNRLTYLLRPHASRLDIQAVEALNTPLTTDHDWESNWSVDESDEASQSDRESTEFHIPHLHPTSQASKSTGDVYSLQVVNEEVPLTHDLDSWADDEQVDDDMDLARSIDSLGPKEQPTRLSNSNLPFHFDPKLLPRASSPVRPPHNRGPAVHTSEQRLLRHSPDRHSFWAYVFK